MGNENEKAIEEIMEDDQELLNLGEETEDGTEKPSKKELSVEEQLKQTNDKISQLQKESDGRLNELRTERDARKDRDAIIAELKDQMENKSESGNSFGSVLESLKEKEIVGGEDLAKFGEGLMKMLGDKEEKNATKATVNNITSTIRSDEKRMSERKDLVIPYHDACNIFFEMADKDPSLTNAVRAVAASGGRPAEHMYNLALTSEKGIKTLSARVRNSFAKQLEEEGKTIPGALPGGGSSGDGKQRIVSDADFLAAAEDAVNSGDEKALEKFLKDEK